MSCEIGVDMYYNQVSLMGRLFANPADVKVVNLKGDGLVPAIEFEIRTDSPSLGGLHRCLAHSDNALRIVAYSLASKDPLEVDLRGWIRSCPDNVVIVTEKIRFFVSSTQRNQAEFYMTEIKDGKLEIDLNMKEDPDGPDNLVYRDYQETPNFPDNPGK